jgi:hypothetical protein
VAALCVLLANDWLFKPALIGPALLRGKLSDFAGLFLVTVPMWPVAEGAGRLACGRWLPTRVLNLTVAWFGLVVSIVFVTVKLSPTAARLAEALWPWPRAWGESRLVVDPTDLLTLPMLPLGFFASRSLWLAVAPRDEERRVPSRPSRLHP